MYEETSYEPLAEVFVCFEDAPNAPSVYCLCSRVVLSGDIGEEEEAPLDPNVLVENVDEESVNKYFHSSTESPPPQVKTIRRKEHEEALSCYCSASHCSTDEHDSVRESALHSDSGADLSECSRDLDWEKYWATYGERIVWESWIAKYGDYVDPNYLNPTENDSEDTQFNIHTSESSRKVSFSGILDSINELNESGSLENIHSTSPECNGRKRSRSELSVDDLRLSCCSQSSGKSSILTNTTDSLTNVTHMTLYSSEQSCSDSSGQSVSYISSSDSISSNEQQWHQLWTEHFNEQYQSCYLAFSTNHKLSTSTEPFVFKNTISKDSLEEEHSETICTQPPTDAPIKVAVDDSTSIKVTRIDDKLSSSKSRNEINSVGYLLKSLKSLSFESSMDSEDGDQTKNGNCDPHDSSISVDIKDNCDKLVSTADSEDRTYCDSNMELESNDCDISEKLSSLVSDDKTICDLEFSTNEEVVKSDVPDTPFDSDCSPKQGRKRPRDTSSLDRMKGAFNLMGFVFKDGPIEDKIVKRADIVYKKRNIRAHNRFLHMKPRQSQSRNFALPVESSLNKVKKFFENTEVAECDDFSEKDDSSGEDAFYSADDWLDKSSPSKPVKKKKKKKMFRKSNLPKEIAENDKLTKYWCNRYRLFSKYDQGILLDAESWFSVTPEKVSKHIAERCRCDVLIDAFCGAGGNAIQFAFTCERVIAIDIDPKKIELARNNAKVYGVEDRIEFIIADFFEIGKRLVGDVVFLSPPWGGPEYTQQETYNLNSILPPAGGQGLLKFAQHISPNIAFYLPRSVNTQQLMEVMEPGTGVEVEQNFLDKNLVAVTAYFGELIEMV